MVCGGVEGVIGGGGGLALGGISHTFYCAAEVIGLGGNLDETIGLLGV
jgi:hypothetical protein